MIEQKEDRRRDLKTRQAIERILTRYEKQTGESSTDLCTQPRRLYESLLFEFLEKINGNYGCVMRLAGTEVVESPYLELISSISRGNGGRLTRQYDTLLNRKPDSLINTVLHTGNGMFINNKRSMVPDCLPDCRPSIDNCAVLTFCTNRQTPYIIFLANSDRPFNYSIIEKLQTMLDVFTRIHKNSVSSKGALKSKAQLSNQGSSEFKRLLDASFNGVMTMDSTGIVSSINPACQKYLDVAENMAIGRSAKEFISAQAIDRLIDEVVALPKNGRFTDQLIERAIDSVGFRSDGSDFPIKISSFFTTLEDSAYVTLIIDDISDRYESARESEQALVQLKTLTNLAPVGILQLSVDWTCQYANDMWYQLSDLTSEESIGKGWIDAIHRDDLSDTLEELRSCVCKNEIFKKEIRLQQPLGSITWVNLAATSMVDEQHRLSGFLIVVTDITEKHNAAERLRQLAHHDALTGLLNRMFFLDRLEDALQSSPPNGNVALLCIDLDGFKNVNDTLGHDAGDSLLKEVAERLRTSVRSEDIVARLGGDEFMVTLQHIKSSEQCEQVADKILSLMRKPFAIKDVEVCISASIGVAIASEHGITADELIKQSDVALYLAKQEGKSRAEFYTPELNELQIKQAQLKTTVKQSVEHRKLTLHYQPQIDVVSKKLKGFEALLRMPQSFGKDSMPHEVIEVLEDTGLVSEVGVWALNRACQDFMGWRKAGLVDSDCTVSVNVSARQLGNEEFIKCLEDVIADFGMPPQSLVIEITETAFIHSADETVNTIHRIKSLGVKVALDDFGTGYSSLAYLSRLPIDHLKIDKSFILDLQDSPERLAIVRAIIALSKALSMTVVAEGVECEAVLQQLEDEGCDVYQGFYYSKPLSPLNTHKFLTELAPTPHLTLVPAQAAG